MEILEIILLIWCLAGGIFAVEKDVNLMQILHLKKITIIIGGPTYWLAYLMNIIKKHCGL